MKWVFLSLNILLFNSTNFCQEVISDPEHEIFCGSENYNSRLTYKLEPIGTIWDVYWPNSTTHIFTIDTDGSSNGGTFIAELNRPISFWQGYNYIAKVPVILTKNFGFGMYKLSVLNKYIYLDWRDTRYGWYSTCNGHCADIYVKYDGIDGNLYVKNDAEFSWGNAVSNGSYLSIWELKNQGIQLTSAAPNYWQNALVIIYSPNNKIRPVWGPNPNQSNITKYYLYRNVNNGGFTRIGEFNNQTFDYIDNSILFTGEGGSVVSYKVTSYNGIEYTPTNIAVQEYYFEFDWSNGLILTNSSTHPKLVWVPHPTYNATNYRVYRAVSNYPVNPASLNYTLVQTVNSSTFEFTDNAVTILPGYQYAYYYVVGWNGVSESAKTNYVGTPAEFHKVQAPESDVQIPKDFALYQNFPNPFNPSTTIKFALPVKTNLSLSVYNTLGEIVAEIFNGELEEGYHEMMFNASGLSSGIYFYKIESENFNSTKKMILMK